VFVNDTEIVHFSYERYLENFFRKTFGFEGSRFDFFRSRKKKRILTHKKEKATSGVIDFRKNSGSDFRSNDLRESKT
jgi:hypothetical protein